MLGCERIRLIEELVGSGIAPGSGSSRVCASGALIKRRLNGKSWHNHHWQPRPYDSQPRSHYKWSIHRQPWSNHQQPGRSEDHDHSFNRRQPDDDRIRERRKPDDRWRNRRASWRCWVRRRRQRS
jgi:hypothetical protein